MVRDEYNHSRPVSALIRDWLLYSKAGGGGGIMKTVTGNPISVSDALAAPIQSLSVSLSPIQTGSGDPSPDNIRPITGRTAVTVTRTGGNVFGGDVFANACHDVWGADISEGTDGKYWTKPNGGGLSDLLYFSDYFKVKENTAYTFIFDGVATNNVGFFRIFYTDGTSALPLFPTTRGQVVFTSSASKTIRSMDIINRSGDRTVYFATSGIFEGVLTAADFEPYDGQSATVQLGQTVYGGTVDVTGGKIHVTHELVDLSTVFWNIYSATNANVGSAYVYFRTVGGDYTIRNPVIWSSSLPYDGEHDPGDVAMNTVAVSKHINNAKLLMVRLFTGYYPRSEWQAKLAEMDAKIVIPLLEPFDIDITPASLSTLRGDNNVWSDGDDVTMTYKAASE